MSNTSKKSTDPLLSQDKSMVKKEIQRLRSEGKLSDVPRIVDGLKAQHSSEMKGEIIALLSDTKADGMVDQMIDQIKTPENKGIIQDLVEICWQSQLDYTAHLDFFVDVFLTSDYATAIEAFSLVETSLEEKQVDHETCQALIHKIKTVLFDLNVDMKNLAVELIHVLDA